MSAHGPFSSATHSFSSDFLKGWVDQAGALQGMFARLVDQSTAAMPGMPPPLLTPWKDFAAVMGMGGLNPEQLFPAAPALGLSREYQETAARLLDLSKRFQQRYAEFA